ncbi:uncharacterized protein [Pseudorasbora parva]|uniref:uncharacterized protein isoform X1 n=1 Tax=Pseudorasbora parva TaxID=51549 RepID=UPI00351F48B8
MASERCFCRDDVHSCHPDHTLPALLQIVRDMDAETHDVLCARLQEIINMYPESIDMYFTDDTTHHGTNLNSLELLLDQYPITNLSERLQELLNYCIQEAQHGGGLNNESRSKCTDTMFSTGDIDAEQPSTSTTTTPTGNNDVAQSLSTNSALTTGNSLSEQPTISNTDRSPARHPNIETLIRHGGTVNGYHVLPKRRFNSVQLRRSMNLREINSTDLATYHNFLHDTFSDIVSFARDIGGEGSIINLSVSSSSLKSPINSVLTPGNNYDVGMFLDQFERVLQSDDRILSDDAVEIDASIAMNRQGGGGQRRKLTSTALHQVIKKKKMSLFAPVNISNKLCFSICLAHFLNPQTPDSELERLATIIHNNAGFSIHDKIGLDNVGVFENLLGIKIVVFYRTNAGAVETYKNNDDPHPKTVCLYLHDDHYYMILNLTAFIGTPYVCEFCYKGYTNRRNHHCKHVCNVCYDSECYRTPKRTVHCPDCLRFCKSSYCFEMHKKNVPDLEFVPCNVIKYCKLCNRRYTIARRQHTCEPSRCVHCHEILPSGASHQCFIQPVERKTLTEKYIFYDFETRYENGKHVANFVCAITFKGKAFVAEGPDCIARLITRFRQPRYNGYCFIAHYASRFDSFLILEYFCKAGLTLDVIMQGCKLIFMYDDEYEQRYIDSYAFIPMALSKMPDALNLYSSGKGYFPHVFNTAENDHYIGPYPDKKYYSYDNMSDKDRVKFDAWYSTTTGQLFDFKKQLYDYGVNDVVLLREACMKYREAFIECTQLDPFAFTTLASCSMGVFKTHYLDRDTLALTHNNAYVRQSKTYSNASIEWLEFVKKTRDVDIHHAVNHGEVSIGRYFLDGYYEQDGVKHGLEYNGCIHHGHSCRFEPHHKHPLSRVPFSVLRRQFDEKIEILQNSYGLQIEVLWECEWGKLKKTDPDVMEFMSTYTAPERLKPRDALFGGRTNAYKLYHKTNDGEKISYVDFTSLYPFCQARKSYPIGHPQIIFKDFEPIENYYGLIKAKVYPPRKLLHPVLPYRCNGKLMFPLCRTCAHAQNQTAVCNHDDEDRALDGCWVTLELLKAIEKGYVVAKIDEVWHFSQQSDSLFSEYVKTFLRLKQQASGYPSNVITASDKESYIREYYEKEGIQLDPNEITHNPAQRAINKLLLNSLWGRFSMRERLPQTTLVNDPEQFTRIVFGETSTVSYFSFVSDDVALVQHLPAKGDDVETNDINVFVGAFTTAHARLELYELMDKLDDRLLYSDTDSVIFLSRDGDWDPPLGDHLGELTNEIDDGDYITEFCSSGPKSYGYRTAKGKVCMKAKGITLNAKNSKVICLDSLIGLVDNYVTSSDDAKYILAHSENIVRNKKTLTLHNKSVVKRFKVVYNKRRLLPDFTTLPYGY